MFLSLNVTFWKSNSLEAVILLGFQLFEPEDSRQDYIESPAWMGDRTGRVRDENRESIVLGIVVSTREYFST